MVLKKLPPSLFELIGKGYIVKDVHHRDQLSMLKILMSEEHIARKILNGLKSNPIHLAELVSILFDRKIPLEPIRQVLTRDLTIDPLPVRINPRPPNMLEVSPKRN